MSEIGEFELIGRIVAQIRDSNVPDPLVHSGTVCPPEQPCLSEPTCHPERSEGSVPPGVLGIGDDCAIIPQREGLDTLVSTDLLIEGRHFLLDDISPYELGWKSAAVNISDIAAMGGRPTAAFLSIALPAGLAERLCSGMTERVSSGAAELSSSGLAERLSSGAVSPESVASLPLPQVGPSRSKPRAAMLSEETAPRDNRSAGMIGIAPDAAESPSPVNMALDYVSNSPGASSSGIVSCVVPEASGILLSGNKVPLIYPEAEEGGDSRPSTDEGLWVDWFIRGFNDVCRKYGVVLLGGDTSASPSELFINVTVMGECAHGVALRRDGARPGDLVCVTGPLGDSATGLKLILERAAAEVLPVRPTMGGLASKSAENALSPPTLGRTGSTCPSQMRSGVQVSAPETSFSAQNAVEGPSQCTPDRIFGAEAALIRRHYLPEPRVEMGEVLAATAGVHAMMDISDGIASDLRHILKASGVGATIDVSKLPISSEMRLVCEARGWDQAELAVGGGEDYELLFTAAPGTALPEGCIPIGIIDAEPGLRWLGGRKEYKGFTHF